MTDQEFDVLDELYFVQPFSFLIEELEMEEEELKQVLFSLLQKGYIKCLFNMKDEVFEGKLNFKITLLSYDFKTDYILAFPTPFSFPHEKDKWKAIFNY